MTRLFDPMIYPGVARYVASLPDGLDSYPECTCRADVPGSIRDQFPEVYDGKGMSLEARQRLLATWKDDEWIPDATNIALRLMGRDRICRTDEEYLDWCLKFADQVFQRPLYRTLMHIVSPTLALLGVQKRWSAFRRGTTVESSGRRKDGTATVTVRFPPRLYPRLMSESVGMTFRAALTAARAKHLRVRLAEHTDTASRFSLVWD